MFTDLVTTEEQLRTLYRQPSDLVVAKKFERLDAASASFVRRSPFALVATESDTGVDVSPRGGRPGFVKLLDDRRLVVPDLPGNNLLDTITNVIRTGRIGMLFLVPGKDETVRVNGRASVTTTPELCDLFVDEMRRPTAVIGVDIDEVFVHCAKAFRRSTLWDPSTWAALADAPDASDMLVCQGLVGDLPVDQLRVMFESGYAAELAAEAPDTVG
jgi:uncharacterized protein